MNKMFLRLIYLKIELFPNLKITVNTLMDVRNEIKSQHRFLKSVNRNTDNLAFRRVFSRQSVSGHSSEQSITRYNSQPTVTQL